jgi:SAM-dependent methyltransferase
VDGPRADPGSFRDPLSRIYVDGEHVWRGLSAEGLADFRAFEASSCFTAAQARGDLVATELVDDPPALDGGWAGVLRHGRIDVLSYPYEWSFEMLRDAALLELRLTREALADGVITKDASAYNVQFVGAQPVFIDVGSFERLRGGEPWPGYRQFCETFLNPLLVQALRGIPFQPLLRGSTSGISPAVAAAMLRGARRLSKDVFTHVRLHARAERRYADADRERDVKAELQRAGFGPRLIDAQLRNLERMVSALSWEPPASTWSAYSDRSHYAGADLAAKERFVADAVGRAPGALVLDLGANDGHFSRLALTAGAGRVVAVDNDHVVVDRLYRELRRAAERRILPLVVDLADPPPALGWRGRERPSFVDRVRPDVVLCLAVVHHLALTDTVPLDEIVAFLADLGAPLVVEFPHHDDAMAARLLARKRPGVFAHYRRANWEAALARHVTVHRTETLPGGTRTLYLCTPLSRASRQATGSSTAESPSPATS